jgi:peptidyl-dipeptidase Dcp
MNVLLERWETPFGLPPFARVRDEDFGPAFDAALEAARANIRAIAEGPAADFAGVIEALELAEGDLDRVAGVFYNLAGADSTEAREALMRELAPKMSAFSSEVTNNKALWAKVEALWQGRDALGLTAADVRPVRCRTGRGRGRAADGRQGAARGVGDRVRAEPAGG